MENQYELLAPGFTLRCEFAEAMEDGICLTTQFEFNWSRIATIFVSAVFAMFGMLIYKLWLWWMMQRLEEARRQGEAALQARLLQGEAQLQEQLQRREAEVQGRLQPLEQANLATRVLQAENNVMDIQCRWERTQMT